MDPDKFSFGVNILGSFQSEKGIGTAVRGHIDVLESANIPYVLNNSADSGSANINKLPWSFSENNPLLFNLIHINPHTTVKLQDSNINFYEYLANNTYFMQGHYNIGYWVWELDRIPEYWMEISNYLDEIWTPSDFCFQALSKGLHLPVVKAPHSIHLSESSFKKVISRSNLNIPNDICLFLFMFDSGSYIERKNPSAVVESFKKAFSPADKAMLYIKTAHTDFNKHKFYELLNSIKGYNIIISDAVLTSDETYSLISLCDCYISLHRSEGFGLTMAEAMALGKPVIATGYSGNMDFMNMENSYPADYRLIKIEDDYGVYGKGNYWTEPDVNHAAELMRHVFENRDEAAAVGEKGREHIKKFFSPTALGRLYKKRLNAIMEDYENAIS